MSRYGGERYSGGPERWDPERFSRERERVERARGPPVIERERFEEYDRYEPRGGGGRRRESSADDSYYSGRGGGRGGGRYEEKEQFIFEERERFVPQPERRPRGGPGRYYDEEADSFDGSPQKGQMVPFARERPARRAPPRPGMLIRRQSSLDTFDRKPAPRYGNRMKEPPEVIPIPVRERRMVSPPRYVERDYEEIKVSEPEYWPEEEFKGYRERERSTVRRRRAGSEVEVKEKVIEYEEVEPEKEFPRKGKTKMPMRLVNKRAIIELGYQYEEEGETIIVLKALGKEHIDEIIKISREMNEKGENRTTYLIEAPPPPPPEQPTVIERRTTEIIIDPPPPQEVPRSVREWDVMSGGSHHTEKRAPSPHQSERRGSSPSGKSVKSSHTTKSRRHRSRSSPSPRREIIEEEHGESNAMSNGPLAIIMPERRKDDRSIKAEIRALEAERKALKLEREVEKEHRKAGKYRDSEIIIERDRRHSDVVEIKKDRKAPNPKLIKAMLGTLT